MRTIATFNEADSAEPLRQRLAQAGINTELVDESRMQRLWFISKPRAGAKIKVDEADFERAKELLNGLDATEEILHDAVRCPQCRSSRIEYPQFTRRFVLPTLVEIFCVLPFTGRQFFCKDCQYTWPLEKEVEPERDALGWPIKDKEKQA
jgi:predicted Zn-ribbon and HTH transcriptional regulator